MGLFSKIKKVATKPFRDVRKVTNKLPGGAKINAAVDGVFGALPGGSAVNNLAFGVEPAKQLQQMAQPVDQAQGPNYATVDQLDDYYSRIMDTLSALQPIVGGSGMQQQPTRPAPQGPGMNSMYTLNNLAYRGNNPTPRGGFGQLYGGF